MSLADDFAAAIEQGDVAAGERLLAEDPELVHGRGWIPPPLHCAVLSRQPQVARTLLDHGADLESLDHDRQTTPLRYAILFASKEVLPVLIARGANLGPIRENGTTALELAWEAADGAYEAYDDLPRASAWREVGLPGDCAAAERREWFAVGAVIGVTTSFGNSAAVRKTEPGSYFSYAWLRRDGSLAV